MPSSSTNISMSPSAWFVHGFVAAVILCAAFNALSYFGRSDGWGNLLGKHPMHREAIGFPVQAWEEGNDYGGYFVDYPALLINVTFAAGLGAVLGLIAWGARRRLNRLVDLIEQELNEDTRRSFQFSMRGLLLTTALVALVATGLRYWLAARPEVLGVIFLIGPWLLVGLAMLPRKIPWQQRVALIIPLAIGLILVAVAIGGTLQPIRNFDQVLMGIFICWTPQAALAATGMTIGLLFIHRDVLMKSPPAQKVT